MPFLNVDYDFIKQCLAPCEVPLLLLLLLFVGTILSYTFNNHQHQPLSQNAKSPHHPYQNISQHHPELLVFTRLHFIIRNFQTPHTGSAWEWCFFFFLDDVVSYAAVYIYVINFIFHFSLKSGIMQILNAIFYGCMRCVGFSSISNLKRCRS